MGTKRRTGIVIYDRYRHCAGGKCFWVVEKSKCTFDMYIGREVGLVTYATRDGSPGGNSEYAGNEMLTNGTYVIH